MRYQDIPTTPVLAFLEQCETVGPPDSEGKGAAHQEADGSRPAHSIQHAMPSGVSAVLAKAKMDSLVNRGLVKRGRDERSEFGLTYRGYAYLNAVLSDATYVSVH